MKSIDDRASAQSAHALEAISATFRKALRTVQQGKIGPWAVPSASVTLVNGSAQQGGKRVQAQG